MMLIPAIWFSARICYAMRQAVEKADPVLLEPVVEIESPENFRDQ